LDSAIPGKDVAGLSESPPQAKREALRDFVQDSGFAI
jgi:hypothetical protein